MKIKPSPIGTFDNYGNEAELYNKSEILEYLKNESTVVFETTDSLLKDCVDEIANRLERGEKQCVIAVIEGNEIVSVQQGDVYKKVDFTGDGDRNTISFINEIFFYKRYFCKKDEAVKPANQVTLYIENLVHTINVSNDATDEIISKKITEALLAAVSDINLITK